MARERFRVAHHDVNIFLLFRKRASVSIHGYMSSLWKLSMVMMLATLFLCCSPVQAADGNGTGKTVPNNSDNYIKPPSAVSTEDESVRIEDLGENWQYKRDSEKVPEIMKAMKTVKTNPKLPLRNPFPAPFCRTFKKDFLAKKFQVIEPELQILSLNDPRFDKRWLRCNDIDVEDTTATNFYGVFSFPWRGRGIHAELPYRFYRVTMDTNIKNKGQVGDIVEYKEGKAIQTYLLVDLKGCQILDAEQVISPKEFNPAWPDALSMLIRYQGRVMVLSYASYPSYGAYSKNQQKQPPGESNYFVIRLTELTRHEHESADCGWTSPTPREASPKK